MSFSTTTLLFLSLAIAAVHCQSLVDITGLKVCTTPNCITNDNIEKLQDHATELAQSLDLDPNHNSPPSYDNFYQFTTGTIKTEVMDTCNALGSQYVTDTINSLTDELTTIANYADALKSSCAEILDKDTNVKDGNYNMQRSDGTMVNFYCLMTANKDKCDGTGGWMRIGYFNTNSSDNAINQCPDPLVYKSYDEISYPLCQRESTSQGCDSVWNDNKNLPYSQVCGRAIGYTYGSPDSFTGGTIDSNYLDGLSFTYGSSPRTHIWSLTGGVNTDGLNHWDCPCNNFNPDNPPDFVGNDYYCETGLIQGVGWSPAKLQYHDPVWDGEQCESLEGGCCKGTNLPYFVKDLGKTVTDRLEMRMCDDEVENNERLPLELLELYVK